MFFLRGKFTHLKLGYEGLWDDHMVFLVSPATSRSGSNFNRNLSCELIPNDGEIVRELITLPPPPLMSEQFRFSNDTPPKKKKFNEWFTFKMIRFPKRLGISKIQGAIHHLQVYHSINFRGFWRSKIVLKVRDESCQAVPSYIQKKAHI